MVPSNIWPHTHHDVTRQFHERYEQDIQAGKYKTFSPWDTWGPLVVVLYMLIPHRNRPWLRKARFLVFAINLAHTVYMIRNVRAKGVATSMGIGLISAWSTIYALGVIVCNDPQTDFMRIERIKVGAPMQKQRNTATPNGNGISTPRKNQMGNGSTSTSHITGSIHNGKEHFSPSQCHFAWQPYPLSPFRERLDWVLDLFTNFIGAGWNWRNISTPPPPKSVQQQLLRNSTVQPPHTFRTHLSQTHAYPTRRVLLIDSLKTLVKGYFILDAIKAAMSHDPYFWGYVDRTPAPYLPSILLKSPFLIHALRMLICQYAIKTAIESIFALPPLFFCGIFGPSIVGARAEPWMYAPAWGPYTLVLNRGLAGWWGGWWHQTFRFAFEQPSRKIMSMTTGMNRKGIVAKLLTLSVAFTLSGILHASGSLTSLGHTGWPTGSLLFFVVQIPAVALEAVLRSSLRNVPVSRWVKCTLTFAYVHVWFYHTAHLLCDDFARGGVWLWEPFPLSLLRGLGLGGVGDGWLPLGSGAWW